ncbi:MAG TPA: glycosyltransferase family 2 protein [Providencia sp.]|nr:glycosyltransferase family 2 protein [Providencia sp.]
MTPFYENQMKFSIILPTYNVEKYIDRCLNSCVNQSYKNIEIIIVDDCGNDNSIYLAKQWMKKDSRIKIIHYQKNLGTYHARKIGTENATGEYVLFLDPDDEIELTTIETIFNLTIDYPDIIIYGSKRIPAPKFWQVSPAVPILNKTMSYNECLNIIFSCKKLSYGTEGKVIRRKVLLKSYESINLSNDIKITYGEDVLLFASILLNINNAISTPQKLYIYHKNDSSITVISNREVIIYKINQIDNVMNYISQIGVTSKNEVSVKINQRLYLDKIRLLNLIEGKKSNKIKNHFKIISLTRSLRDVIKLIYSLMFVFFK